MSIVTVTATAARADPASDLGSAATLVGGSSCLSSDDGDTSYAQIPGSSGTSYAFVGGDVLFTLTAPLPGVTAITSADIVVVAKHVTGTDSDSAINAGFTDTEGSVSAWGFLTSPSLTGNYATYQKTLSRPPFLADLRAGTVVGAAGFPTFIGQQMRITYAALVLTTTGLAPLRQFPRDDALGGQPRQFGSKSVQASARQGWAGTYR